MTYNPAALPAAYTHVALETLDNMGGLGTHPVALHEVDREQIRGLRGEFGLTPTAGDLMAYVRLGDAVGGTTGKGIWVPAAALTLPPYAFNGAFQVWQDGTSFASIADATYTADGWRYGKVGAMVHDVSRSTNVPAVAALHPLQTYSALIDCTTVDSSIAAGDYAIYENRAEGFYWGPFHQRAFVLPFWHAHTKTGTYCVAFVNGAGDRSYVAQYTQSVADAWEFATIVVSASPSAGTWALDTSLGLRTVFTLAAGSTFQTTANAWQTGLFYGTSSQVNACDNTANNFRIAMVRPNLGTVALPFSPNGVAADTLIAERYFQTISAASGNTVFASGKVTLSTSAEMSIRYRRMRATPTVTVSSAAHFEVDDNTIQACTALVGDLVGFDSCRLQATVASGLTGTRSCLLRAASTTSAQIKISARL